MTKARSNAVAEAAKGDLSVGSGTNLAGILAVGNNGETLVADSSTSTGLRYQGSIAGGKNFIINGGFDNWQRGTSFSNPISGYTADRFAATWSGSTTYTVSQQASFLTSSRYALRVQRTSGTTSTASLFLGMGFETIDVIKLQGKTVTWSFYIKAGSNYSPTGGGLGVSFYTGTGIDQGPFVGHTGEVTQVNVGQTITTTATRYSYTFTVPTNATSARFNFAMVPSGTAGTNDFYEVTNMQLEIGSVATEFSRAGGTIQGELAACQRYYQQYAGGLGVPYNAVANSATTLMTYLQIQPTMRTAATCTVGGTLYADDGYAGTVNAASPTVDFVDQYQGGGRFRIGGFSGMTTGRQYSFYYNTGYIGLSAEL